MKRKIFGRHLYLPTDALKSSRRIEVLILERYLQVQEADRLCDIGSGTGFWMKRITKNARTVGIEIDWAMAAVAQAKFKSPQTAYVMTSAEAMAFPDESFTKIYGLCSVEHIPDNVAAFREFHRCLKPGGVIALTLDSLNYPDIQAAQRESHAEKYFVPHFYSLDYAKNSLDAAGFDLTDHRYIICSPLAHWFYKYFDRIPRLQYLLFPLCYPLIRLSDALQGSNQFGWKLAVRAVKRSPASTSGR